MHAGAFTSGEPRTIAHSFLACFLLRRSFKYVLSLQLKKLQKSVGDLVLPRALVADQQRKPLTAVPVAQDRFHHLRTSDPSDQHTSAS